MDSVLHGKIKRKREEWWVKKRARKKGQQGQMQGLRAEDHTHTHCVKLSIATEVYIPLDIFLLNIRVENSSSYLQSRKVEHVIEMQSNLHHNYCIWVVLVKLSLHHASRETSPPPFPERSENTSRCFHNSSPQAGKEWDTSTLFVYSALSPFLSGIFLAN